MDTKTQQAIASAFQGMTQAEQDKMMAVLDSIRGRGDENEPDEAYYTNVTKAMQAAGWSPVARAKAGLKAWMHNKMESTKGSGIHSSTEARWLRFFGMGRTADFIDRWFTGPKSIKKGKKGKKAAAEKSTTEETRTSVSTESGELIGFKKQLDVIHDIVQMTADDVTDIKSLLMPKGVVAKDKDGNTEFVQFNPLAPPGEQFAKVTESGKITAIKPSKQFQQSAQKKAALATADLVLKILEKDRKKAELRKKYEYKDKAEAYQTPTPPEEEPEKALEKKEDNTGWFVAILTGISNLVKGFLEKFAQAFPLLNFIGRMSAIGFAAWAGWKIGSWIWDNYGTKILDGVFWVKDKLMSLWEIMGDIGAKIRGVAERMGILKSDAQYKEEEKKNAAEGRTRGGIASTGSMSLDENIAHYEKLSKDPKLTEQQREANERVYKTLSSQRDALIAQRTARVTGGKIPAPTAVPAPVAPSTEMVSSIERDSDAWETNYAPAPKQLPQVPAVGNTGTLTASTYDQRLKALGDVIASGESGGDYNIYNKGTIGKNKGKIGREDLSKMSIAEYLRRASLDKDDPQKMFAVGKYQIIPDTMRDAVQKLGLNPATTTLDPPTQERIFAEYLTKSRRPNIHAYLTGKSDDLDAAIMDMAKEWASVGVPHDTYRGDTLIKKGQSYYSGVGGNIAHTSADSIASAVTPTPTIPGTTLDKETRTMQASNSPASQTVVVSAPTLNSTKVTQTVAKRPAAKADVLAQDKSLVRTITKDTHHPVYG